MLNQDILNRLRKLYVLTSSPNEHEAALAASRVQELLIKHNLDIGVLDNVQEQKAHRLSTRESARRQAHEYILARAIEQLLDVRHFMTINKSEWSRERKRRWSSIVFVGLESNVETAILTFNYLCDAVEEICKSRKYMLHGKGEHRDYKLGAAQRIRAEIIKHKEQTMLQGSTECLALVRVGCEVAKKAYEVATQNATKGQPIQGARNFSAYNLGYADGAQINPNVARNSKQLASA